MAQIQPRAVAKDLGIEGRFAIGEACREAELLFIERPGGSDVADKSCGSAKARKGFSASDVVLSVMV